MLRQLRRVKPLASQHISHLASQPPPQANSIENELAVVYGKLIAGKISKRWLTGLIGGLFLLFGDTAIVNSL